MKLSLSHKEKNRNIHAIVRSPSGDIHGGEIMCGLEIINVWPRDGECVPTHCLVAMIWLICGWLSIFSFQVWSDADYHSGRNVIMPCFYILRLG